MVGKEAKSLLDFEIEDLKGLTFNLIINTRDVFISPGAIKNKKEVKKK